MEAFLSGIWDIEMDLMDGSDFANGADGLDSVLMVVVVLMLSMRLSLLILRRLRLVGNDSRVFAVMVDMIQELFIDE